MHQPDGRGFSEPLLSARGIAALSVFLYHMPLAISGAAFQPSQRIITSVLAGESAVVFFLVHSGFVLALGFREVSGRAVIAFYMRRLFRLWPMIVFTCVVAALCIEAFGTVWWSASLAAPPRDGDLSFWRNLWLSRTGLNWFMWSLQVEVLGSFLLPLIILGCRKVLPSLVMLLGALTVWAVIQQSDQIRHLEWLGAFVAGAVLAYGGSKRLPLLFVPVAVASILWGRHFLPVQASIVLEAIAAMVIVQAIYYHDWAALKWRPLLFLGRISYSFYINSLLSIHLAGLVFDRIDTMAAVLLCIGVALAINLALSTVTYQLIERPGIALGKRLSRMIRSVSLAQPDAPATRGQTAPE